MTEIEKPKKTKAISVIPNEIGSDNLLSLMTEEADKRKLITQFISSHMKRDIDFGSLMIKGRKSKPSLFKAGSEKFISLFKLTPIFNKDVETWEMAGSKTGLFAFRCQLFATNGSVVGEGRGIASMDEKEWSMNSCMKIAEKRAQIDAVLRTGALSDFFTQDLEDDVVIQSQAAKPKTVFEIASEMIEKTNDLKVLNEFWRKIFNSPKYSTTEKEKLEGLIAAQVEKIEKHDA